MSAGDHLAAEIYRRVTGFERVTGFFGYWPSFHDAEIVSLLLERTGRPEHYEGPVVTMKLATREWRHDPATGRTVTHRNAVVEFRFTSAEGFHLAGFDYQNAIDSLELRPAGDERFPGRLRVSFRPGTGVAGSFSAEAGVTDVAPLSEADPYHPATP